MELTWVDYSVFGFMLVLGVIIGLFKGSTSGSTARQLLLADGKLTTLPVSLSMLASFLSSITLMGQPAEVYLFGPQQWVFGIASVFVVPLAGYSIIPFFRRKKYVSVNQYLGERFSRSLQLIASVLFTFQMVTYLSLVLYAPALAMNQVSGIDTVLIITIMYIVCVAYTAVGGIKGVVWADVFQIIVIFTSMAAILVKGTNDIGGISVVWERNSLNNRTNFFNFNVDPTERYSFWSSFFGLAFLHIATYGGNQLLTQRYLVVPTIKDVRRMLWINVVGWTIIVIMCTYAGMLIFAQYYDCDPLGTHRISKADQLFPLFVKDVIGQIQGFSGFFISGVFSAGLSTVSTGLNSLAAVWYAELRGTRFLKGLDESESGRLVKYLALVFGVVSYLLVYLVPYMGPLVPLAISLTSISTGSLFTLYILGIYVSFANSLGALSGLLCSLGVLSWISLGAYYHEKSGHIIHSPLPMSTENCSLSLVSSRSEDPVIAPFFYRISHTWYCFVAIVVCFCVGTVVSFATRNMHFKFEMRLTEGSKSSSSYSDSDESEDLGSSNEKGFL